MDGSSTLSRFFDDRPFHAALWFQSAGDTRGQAWAGLFRDEDNNGVMEFAPPDAPLPEGTWTHELNFLGWRPAAGGQVLDLPAGAHVRVALQWREAHDPEYVRSGEDRYREPLAAFRLLLLSQPDPAGARQPADDLVVVAESAGLPERLDNQPGSATYEQTVELRVAKAGRFALRVEGKLPEGIRPHNSAALPFMRKTGEVRPRILVTTLAGPEGRAVWHDYVTETGSLGMPADAHRVTTVGAEDLDNRPAPFGASGPAYNLELLVKPDVWAYDQVEGARGTGPAAGFAAGLAASACSAGVPLVGLPHALSGRPGALLRAPKE